MVPPKASRSIAASIALLSLFLHAIPGRGQIAFEDVTDSARLSLTSQTYGVAWGDYDGDGWVDLRVGHHANPTGLYRNNGDGTFSDASSLLQPSGAASDWHTGAWADFDNDGDQDLIVIAGAAGDENPFANRLFVNQSGVFAEEGLPRGIAYAPARGRQPVWWDWNNDGLLDLAVLNLPRATEPSTIFVQSGGSFTPMGLLPASELSENTEFAQLGDLHGAGRLDLITGGGHPYSYRILDSTSTPFTDITDASGIGSLPLTFDAAIADFSGDLLPDVFLSRHTSSRSDVHQISPSLVGLFLTSLGREIGADITSTSDLTATFSYWSLDLEDVYLGAAGTHPAAYSIPLSATDPTLHGIAPHVPGESVGIFIGYDTSANRWMVRSSNKIRFEGTFESQSGSSSFEIVGFVPDPGEVQNRLFVRSGDTLLDATQGSGLETPDDCDSVAAGDFDNDGDVDLYLVCARSAGNRPNLLYENIGSGIFILAPDAGGAAGSSLGRGDSVAVADYDQDGFLDLFVANGWDAPPLGLGPHQLFRNVGNANHWIQIDLEGTVSNRDGIGARVIVTADGVSQYRARDGGMHARAQNHKRLHFGLASSTIVQEIRVEWPSGIVQELTAVPADQIITIEEPTPVPASGSIVAAIIGLTLVGTSLITLRRSAGHHGSSPSDSIRAAPPSARSF